MAVDSVKAYLSGLGKRGGAARAKKLTRARRVEIATLASVAASKARRKAAKAKAAS